MNALQPIKSWRKIWREGFLPFISTSGLEALKKALETDDPALLQGATCSPPPLTHVQDCPVEAACAISYCGWKGDGCILVADAEEYLAQRCFDADRILGEPAACRWFLNWFDETPREEMRKKLLEEVNDNLTLREFQQ